jgi:hypothetical protein
MKFIQGWKTRRALRREYADLMFALDACHSERKRLRRLFGGPASWPRIDEIRQTEDAALVRLREITKELER